MGRTLHEDSSPRCLKAFRDFPHAYLGSQARIRNQGLETSKEGIVVGLTTDRGTGAPQRLTTFSDNGIPAGCRIQIEDRRLVGGLLLQLDYYSSITSRLFLS